jgi:arylformamidase
MRRTFYFSCDTLRMIYDITRAITPDIAVFPGDTPVSLKQVMRMADGNSVNVSAITMSVHAGTHIDAPLHYSAAGISIDQVSPDVFLGPARVLSVDVAYTITQADLQRHHLTGVQRLLLHTSGSNTPDDVFDTGFVHFDEAAAEYLGQLGLKLIGIDTPSVDQATSKALPAHNSFLRYNVIIMENLCLTGVPDGDYELMALPIKIKGCDAAPTRALLRYL